MRRMLTTALILSCAQAQAAVGDKIYFGSRAGMEVTIVAVEGIDTEAAVIRTEFTPEDAKRFCIEYVGAVTPECIAEQLELKLNDRVTANCVTGEFVTFFGDHYRFEGRTSDPDAAFLAEYVIRDLTTGEIADGSMASGYPVNIEIFTALCPNAVRNA
jgi:hypothetical protein